MTLFHTVEINDAIDICPAGFTADAADLRVVGLDHPIPLTDADAERLIEALQEARRA